MRAKGGGLRLMRKPCEAGSPERDSGGTTLESL
jgi:hypothetical protein